MWYLHLQPDASAGVVASYYFFEPDIFKVMEYEEVKHDDLFGEAFFCAESFAEFLYRFWMENTIWYSSYKGLQFTPVQADYQKQITRKL